MGRVTVVGGKVGMEAPVGGIFASDIAVGSIVKLMENGSPVDYLVVNQGIPSDSSLYDASCNGMWLLRKGLLEKSQWSGSGTNNYKTSYIHSYLNDTFLTLLGDVEQTTIKQAKIPYHLGTGASGSVASGTSGLSTKVFLLSGCEVGHYESLHPNDGATLDYFADDTTAKNLRVAYLNGTAENYWTRSPFLSNNYEAVSVASSGNLSRHSVSSTTYGAVRPALILPNTALFDKNTLVLKGVK